MCQETIFLSAFSKTSPRAISRHATRATRATLAALALIAASPLTLTACVETAALDDDDLDTATDPGVNDDDDATTSDDDDTGDTADDDDLLNLPQSPIVALYPGDDPLLAQLMTDEPPPKSNITNVTYLAALTTHDPLRIAVTRRASFAADAYARATRASLTIVVGAETLYPERFDQASLAPLGPDGFRIVVETAKGYTDLEGNPDGTIVYLVAATKIARQYAWYELLRRIGARFYHPEAEYLATADSLARVRSRAATPTALARNPKNPLDVTYTPDFAQRGYTFHGHHPLEHLEAFSDSNHPIDEALRVNQWSVKNFANDFRGAGRGIAPEDRRAQRVAELNDLKLFMGMGLEGGPGISLHNTQQGSAPDVDPSLPTPVREQIETFVTNALAADPDAATFGIHFGETEFTVSPDIETVQWINWAGQKALALKPDIKVIINNHITGSQPTPNFDDLGCPNGTNDDARSDFYDLAFHTDPRFGVKVHTVMFYPLEGSAPVYDQKSFAHKLCLMQKASAAGRPLVWFPESSWWLNFDNAIPFYLPLYIHRSFRDIELVKPLLASRGNGTLYGHRLFNSGHEWAYWQQDYVSGLLHFNADVTLDAALSEVAAPLCDGVLRDDGKDPLTAGCAASTEFIAVMRETIDHQRETLLEKKDWQGVEGGLYAYLMGESAADLYAQLAGIEFGRLRTPFTTVLNLSDKDAETLRDNDIAALTEIELAYETWATRLDDLTDANAGGWLAEVRDGLHINHLRARQARLLYEAVLAHRAAEAATDDTARDTLRAAARKSWQDAAKTLEDAAARIATREASYRYPPAQTVAGGMTPETAIPNGTTYGYRVYTTAHLLFYWNNRHEEVRRILDGELGGTVAGVTLTPAFAKPGVPLAIGYPDAATAAAVNLGDNTTATLTTKTHDYATANALYPITGSYSIGDQTIPVRGVIARTTILGTSTKDDFALVSPDSSLAKLALEAVVPAFEWAAVLGNAVTQLAFAPILAEGAPVRFSEATLVEASFGSPTGFTSDPFDFQMAIPDPAGNGPGFLVGMRDATLTGSYSNAGTFGETPITLKGNMVLADIKAILIGFGAFDDKGADSILATALGFDPKNPPETFPVEADITVTPVE